MRKRNTESIGEVLKQYFEENTFLKRKVAESRVVTGWSKMLGAGLASYITNVYLRRDVLYVHLNSAALRQELMMAKERLMKNLNEHAGMHVVNDIVFR